jgi:sulfatase maturation enzyme AslB (radical SAM superfamily)
MDPKKKFYLFKQSKNFCAVPWNYVKVSMDSKVSTCVNGTELLGDVHDTPIEEILKNSTLNRIRDNLRNDRADKNCAECVPLENTGYSFLRGLYNPMFVRNDIDYGGDEFRLSGIDLHWGSTCNLKCITCWAKQSSAIAQEQGVPILSVSATAANNIIDFVVSHQANMREIYLSGGEPTLIKHNVRLLQQLDKNTDCEIRINTNMMFELDNLVISELKKFPNVLFTISTDTAVPDRFNYIRRGADWNRFIANLRELSKMHFRWRVNSVFSVGTALTLPETQEYFLHEFGIEDFTINQMSMGHTYLRGRNLPDTTKSQVIDRLTTHKEKYQHNTNLSGQLTNCLLELNNSATEDYSVYFDSIDALAGTRWRDIFQELV